MRANAPGPGARRIRVGRDKGASDSPQPVNPVRVAGQRKYLFATVECDRKRKLTLHVSPATAVASHGHSGLAARQ